MRNGFLSLLAIAVFGTVSLAQPPKPEPRYKGKPLAYWVDRLPNAETDADQIVAATAILAFGPDAASAAPKLVQMLDDHSVEFRWLVSDILCKLGPLAKEGVLPFLGA